MAKKKPADESPPKVKEDRSNRRSAPIQVDKDIARMAAMVATFRGVTLADLCSPALRPFITTQYRLMQAEMAKELQDSDDAAG
jgi:hypothetical protein